MQMKTTKRSEHDEFKDKVFACLETGNAGQARTLMQEYSELYPEQAERLRSEVVSEYCVVL